MKRPRKHRFRKLKFFWLLILAFGAVSMLTGGGVWLAARRAMDRVSFTPPRRYIDKSERCVDRLSRYYETHRTWLGSEDILQSSTCNLGPRMMPRASLHKYVLATPQGRVVVTNHNGLAGQTLPERERALAIPITLDEQEIGLLILPPFTGMVEDPEEAHASTLKRFLLTGMAIGAMALVAGVGFSRAMSRPVAQLTEATRAVADGNFDVRVPTRYVGEIGELTGAFNQMAVALARADTQRRNLTADVAHELRTPLSVIQGKLEGVLDGVYPATAEHLEPVLEETRLLARLVEDLRLLALADAGQLTLERQPTDVGDLLRDAQVNFEHQAADRGVALELDLPTELPTLHADWRRIAQVLSNLITNALRHTPAGGTVTLAAQMEGESIAVRVSDTGEGIPPEALPYIFERFWRGEKSRSRASGGSGLGLAIAKQIVELHGGTIAASSTPGEGTSITFTLPTEK